MILNSFHHLTYSYISKLGVMSGEHNCTCAVTSANSSTISGTSYIFPTEAMRTKEVDVLWTCLVDPDTAEFSDPKVENYKENLLKDLLVDADFSTRTAYGFPLIPGIDDIG